MTRKRTLFDYALWAALPMAHTSQIEARLTMILDKTQSRRALPRRFLLLAAAAGAAILVPLAMLQPTVKAQSISQSARTSAANGLVQLVGITDAATPNGNEWGVDGKALPTPVFGNHWGPGTKITAKPGQKALFFVFHLSKSFQHVPVLYDISGTTLGDITIFSAGNTTIKGSIPVTQTVQSIQIQSSSSNVIYGAAFPASLTHTDVRVGTFLGHWTAAAIVRSPFQGEYSIANTSGSRFLSTKFRVSGGKIVFDAQLKTPSDFQNLRIFAIDKGGHSLLLHPIIVESRSNREQIIEQSPKNVSHIKELRIESRPLAWTEFKDVALQPVK